MRVLKKKKKTFSMKHAANNTTECECMKSPIPTLSCRSLQHKCFVHVAKYDSFLCVSMIKKKKECYNITKSECMKRPIPTLSCRPLQHNCFVHVAKYN